MSLKKKKKFATQWLSNLTKVPRQEMVPNPRSTCLWCLFLLHVIKLGKGEVMREERKKSRFQETIWALAKSKGHCYLLWNCYRQCHETSLLIFIIWLPNISDFFFYSFPSYYYYVRWWDCERILNISGCLTWSKPYSKMRTSNFWRSKYLFIIESRLTQNSLNSKPICVALTTHWG